MLEKDYHLVFIGKTRARLIGPKEIFKELKSQKRNLKKHNAFETDNWDWLKEEKVTIKPIVLNLAADETLRLTRILVDEDKEEAFVFLKECLKPQLDQATRDHWVPVFEASYKPSQKDSFGRK